MKRIVKIFAIIFFIFILSGCGNNVFDKNKILICDSENEKVDSTQQTDIQIKIEQEMRFDKIRKEKRLRELQNKKEAYENITFEYEYIKNSDEISYGFFTPSIVKFSGINYCIGDNLDNHPTWDSICIFSTFFNAPYADTFILCYCYQRILFF